MQKEVLIDVNDVSRYYGQQCAVDNINFKLHRGEVVGFLGPNGAGKTTSMQMISGILAASSGEISIAGLDILENAKQAKAYIGFLPESPPLYNDLTVDEYLNYAAKLRNMTAATIASAIEKTKQRCGLNEVGHRLIGNLSKGYQQRVGIAQAIIHSPSVVILDEPTSGLDPNQIVEIRKLIRELGSDHSVILSTHILPEVQSVCDRVIIISKGKLVLDESLDALSNRKVTEFQAAFSHEINANELSKQDFFESLLQISEHRIKFHLQKANDINRFMQHMLDIQWELIELIPVSNSLEQIFMQLTQSTYAGEIS